jgi:Polysaccharide lyase
MMYIVLFLLVLLIPLPAQGGLKFSIDYNDGTYGTATKCVATPTYHCVPPNFQSVPHPDGITVTGIPFPVREGTRAVRHIAKPGQNAGYFNPCYLFGVDYTNDSDCDRSESEQMIPYVANVEEWYGFSVYIDPSTQYSQNSTFKDYNGQVVFQLHQLGGPCGSGFGPRFAIYFARNTGLWTIQTDTDTSSSCSVYGSPTSVRRIYTMGSWVTGQWVDFVIHVKWSQTSSGFLQVWKNAASAQEKPVVDVVGVTSLAGFTNTDVKWGVYQSWWRGHTPPAGEISVVFHDGIKAGDQNSSFAEVSPARTATIPNPPSTVAVSVH